MEQKVLVCGGRNYEDRRAVFNVLDAAHDANPIILLIAGGATGADALAIEWARAHCVPQLIYPANWEEFGRRAGPIRNQKMLDEGRPHMVIAFRGGRGTADMMKRSEAAGVPVVTVDHPTTATSGGERTG